MFAIGIFYLINQFKSARFFVLSFSAAVFSIAVMNYYAFATTNDNVFTNNLVIFAVLLKCILLSIAMLDRLKIFKEEKELAQATVISQLQELSDMRAEVNLELKKKVHEKTTELYKKQKEAKLALITGEENERKRIATELHDGLGGLLSTLKLNAESLELENKTHTQAYANVLFLIDKACQELRLLSHNMLPSGIEHLGIELTLKSYIDKLSSGINKTILLDTYGLESIRNKSLELHVYRICSELINNAIKHSQFKNLNVQLIKQNQTLTIIVADDGIGFDPFDTAHSGIGFISIRSRLEALAGDMKFDSLIGKGTTIIIEIPTE
jgi:signal transduction histidine kinase